jgi:hypothetical protein
MFLEFLRTECDQIAFERLRDALDLSNNVPRKDAISEDDQKKDSDARSKAATTLQNTILERSRNCNIGVQPPLAAKSIEVPVGYFDVGCNENNHQTRVIPLSDDLKSVYKIVSARAYFTSTSNLEYSDASATPQGDSVVVNLSLGGVPRSGPFQLNCPGGGHGTVMVHIELSPK